ncbi:hypothetical protein D6T63_12200 [Arthrobacter cheniae]|uniref:Uncharacterized protein n=1 Tax=Arthrobacter cheniae TaxID=1258888 RepID=A0A3A5M9U1_9MICC|nr:hypothetical protein D6T63_12200 [Arthrobacter cheniae]
MSEWKKSVYANWGEWFRSVEMAHMITGEPLDELVQRHPRYLRNMPRPPWKPNPAVAMAVRFGASFDTILRDQSEYLGQQ